jgi:hypothetical protein
MRDTRVSRQFKTGKMLKCESCGSEELNRIFAHHVIPIDSGGVDAPENLMLVCGSCHSRLHNEMREFLYNVLSDEQKVALRLQEEQEIRQGVEFGRQKVRWHELGIRLFGVC